MHEEPQRRRRAGRRAVRALGAAFMVAGVLALLWGFAVWRWGDPITAIYTRIEQGKLADELEERERRFALQFGSGGPSPVEAPTKQTSPSKSATKPTPKPRASSAVLAKRARTFHDATSTGDPLGRLVVDRLGLEMVVAYGTDSGTLKTGPGLDPRTYLPGEGELVYIAGHRTTFGAPFADIDRLKAGDPVILRMPYGTFEYRVTTSVIVPADDLDRLRSRGKEQLALQACYPRFSASQRLIVYAEPVRSAGP